MHLFTWNHIFTWFWVIFRASASSITFVLKLFEKANIIPARSAIDKYRFSLNLSFSRFIWLSEKMVRWYGLRPRDRSLCGATGRFGPNWAIAELLWLPDDVFNSVPKMLYIIIYYHQYSRLTFKTIVVTAEVRSIGHVRCSGLITGKSNSFIHHSLRTNRMYRWRYICKYYSRIKIWRCE